MIKANELRIGNWVGNGSKSKTVTVEDFWRYYNDPLRGFYYYSPIPLTSEILGKCGFKKSGEFDIWYALDGHLSLQLDSCFWWSIDDVGDNEGSHNRKILYLHQLQNLYFALTGTELEVKL